MLTKVLEVLSTRPLSIITRIKIGVYYFLKTGGTHPLSITARMGIFGEVLTKEKFYALYISIS